MPNLRQSEDRCSTHVQPLPPLSLYIHFPWCVKKCPYCDFNSHERRGDINQQDYIDALLCDLDHDLATYPCEQRSLISIFMGGGTPSLFSCAAMAELLSEINRRLSFDETIEITMEANPGAVEHDDFVGYRAAGINRLSLGAQSFNDAHLKQLGRIHNSAEIHSAIDAAVAAGFTNVNFDLMYGLPGQTIDTAMRDLEHALQYSPAHLSLYQLTIEANTWFHRYPPILPQDDDLMEIQQQLHQCAHAHGYTRYEVSAHAKRGLHCRHNLNYWQFGDYLGIGAGAHGKITQSDGVTRYSKQKHPKRYQQQAMSTTKKIATNELLIEFLMNALRLADGFTDELIVSRTARPRDEVITLLGDAIERGLVLVDDSGIRCSPQGYLFLDEVLQGVLSASDAAAV